MAHYSKTAGIQRQKGVMQVVRKRNITLKGATLRHFPTETIKSKGGV